MLLVAASFAAVAASATVGNTRKAAIAAFRPSTPARLTEGVFAQENGAAGGETKQLLASAGLSLATTGEWSRVVPSTWVDDQTPRRLQISGRTAWWGGPMTTSTGETVTIYESDLLARDDATLMSWANFFAWLYHGPELASLTIYQAPLSEVEQICGDDALGCYSPTQKILVFPGDLGQGLEAEIGAHEYGHHVAANRRNDPWDANDYGPKRWASYVGVCAKAAAGTVFPGDEADHYKLNTGEAFAEAYRILNQQRGGTWAYPPLVVDLSLAPDAGAMAAALTDVQQPWAGPVATSWDGQFPPITALTANVGPGKTISVRTGSGTLVKTLTAGTYAITVRDLSTTDDFHLSGGPTVNRKTSVPGTVTTLWKLILPPGSYRYYSDTHPGLAHSFTVTTPAQSALQPQERTLATPLDGTYQTTVTGTAHPSLELIDPTTGQDLVAATQGSITYTICGQRSLRLRILPTNAGSFHLDTAQP